MKEAINKTHRLSTDDYDSLLSIARTVSFRKGDFLLREGASCRGIYYIESGLVGLCKEYKERDYYQDFYFEASFATNIVSLASGKPSSEYLVAIEEVKGKYMSKASLLGLYEKSSAFKEFGRLLLEQLLADKTKLSFIRSSLTSKEKYEYILDEMPHYVQRIPLRFLASYLGMTRETLSRMRNALHRKG